MSIDRQLLTWWMYVLHLLHYFPFHRDSPLLHISLTLISTTCTIPLLLLSSSLLSLPITWILKLFCGCRATFRHTSTRYCSCRTTDHSWTKCARTWCSSRTLSWRTTEATMTPSRALTRRWSWCSRGSMSHRWLKCSTCRYGRVGWNTDSRYAVLCYAVLCCAVLRFCWIKVMQRRHCSITSSDGIEYFSALSAVWLRILHLCSSNSTCNYLHPLSHSPDTLRSLSLSSTSLSSYASFYRMSCYSLLQ